MKRHKKDQGDMWELWRAEGLLFDIRTLTEQIRESERLCETQIQAIRDRFAGQLSALRAALSEHDRALMDLMKKRTDAIFDGKDRVELIHGVLLHATGYKVRIPKGAVEKIEAQGWLSAIKIVKSVDREVVEKWSKDRLAVIGAEKKPVESFSYEVRAAHKEGA